MIDRTKSIAAMAAVVVMGFGFAASADETPMRKKGAYISLNGGANFMPDATSGTSGIKVDTSFDVGYTASGAIGYKFGNEAGLRLEAEFLYSKADISDHVVSVAGLGIAVGNFANVTGDVSAAAGMINAVFDIDTKTRWTPFLMAGAGAAKVAINDAKIGATLIADDSDIVFAYQVGAGINYAVAPKVTIGLSYRYIGITDPSFVDSGGGKFDSEYSSHNVLAGLTVHF